MIYNNYILIFYQFIMVLIFCTYYKLLFSYLVKTYFYSIMSGYCLHMLPEHWCLGTSNEIK